MTRAKELEEALATALAYLARGKPEPYPGHTCYGPDSNCDGNCMDVAYYGQFRMKARALLPPEARS